MAAVLLLAELLEERGKFDSERRRQDQTIIGSSIVEVLKVDEKGRWKKMSNKLVLRLSKILCLARPGEI